MGKPLTYDHLVGKKKPLTKRVAVVLDPDLAELYEEARRDRDMANARAQVRSDDPEMAAQLVEADARLEALRQQLEDEEALAWFTFRGIGRARYEALVDKHPATADQRLKAKAAGMEALAWNHETFPPALVAACSIEPAMTEEEAQRLWDDPDWNQAELMTLLNAAIEVNGSRRTVELGKESRRPTQSGAPKSGTA